jgi:hypothetical protein
VSDLVDLHSAFKNVTDSLQSQISSVKSLHFEGVSDFNEKIAKLGGQLQRMEEFKELEVEPRIREIGIRLKHLSEMRIQFESDMLRIKD